MKSLSMSIAVVALLISSLACAIVPHLPEIDLSVPTMEVGVVREESRIIPLPNSRVMDVDVRFGAGTLELKAGSPDKLLAAVFRYNVDQWRPEITREEDQLTIKQGGDREKWGIPSGNVRNRWELAFSPAPVLLMNVRAGAGGGELDLTGLKVSELDVDVGAGDFILRFDKPNAVPMDHMTLDTGASRIEILGVGNARPEEMTLHGGVGDIHLDLTGAWTRSADVTIRAGAGTLKLTLPSDVGLEVETSGGLTDVEAYGLKQMGNRYTNDAFGNTNVTLHISVLTGVGRVDLIEEGARK